MVAWISFSCPGGIFSGIWPEAARPLVCQRTAELDLFSDRKEADRKIRELGPAAASRLYSCRGLRCQEVRIAWESVVKIGR